MARTPNIKSTGLPLDANLLKPTEENGLDKYFISEGEFEILEITSNKKTDIVTNKTSDTFFPTVKAVYDWAVGLFVKGAASSTDNAIARFDGTTGKLVQDSAVTITDAGNVGIGTTSPDKILTVESTAGLAQIGLKNTGRNFGTQIKGTSVSGGTGVIFDFDTNIFASYNNSSIAEQGVGFRMDTRVGLPALSFHTRGIGVAYPGSTELAKLVLMQNGNVGIGTISPTAKLDVDGTSRFRSSATFNGQIIDNVGSSGSDGQVLENVGGIVKWENNLAQNAVDRLAGDGDYFIGYWGLPNVAETDNAPPSMVSALNQGITWDNTTKKFNFSYLGWYMLVLETSGDMTNTRTDGYQEFRVLVKQNGTVVQSNDLNMPNNTTKNIRTHFTALIKVGLGDSIQIYTKHNTGGTLESSPTGYIRIKKVV